MKEKTQGERNAWGVAAWLWIIAGVGAGAVVVEFVGPAPLWLAIVGAVAWMAVLLLFLDRAGLFGA